MRRTKEEAAKTRKQIVDTATVLFKKRGFLRTTLNDICVEAGLSRGAMYWYFEDKTELFNEVVKNLLVEFHEQKEVVIARTDCSVTERLALMLELPIRYVDSYRLVNSVPVIAESHLGFEELLDDIKESKRVCRDQIRGLLNQSNAEGEIGSPEKIDVLTETLFFLFEGFYLDGSDDREKSQRLIREIVGNLLS